MGTKLNKKGFSTVEVLIVVLVILVLGLGGWYVYKQNHKKTLSLNHSSTVSSTKDNSYIIVVNNDGSILKSSPDKLTIYASHIDILEALHKSCSLVSRSYVVVGHSVFEDGFNFKLDGSHAYINAGVCSSYSNNVDNLSSSKGNYLHKNSEGKWILDTSSQQSPECKYVDGLEYPSDIILSCYDGSLSRAPR